MSVLNSDTICNNAYICHTELDRFIHQTLKIILNTVFRAILSFSTTKCYPPQDKELPEYLVVSLKL